jgi:hypothetical protein
MPLLHAPGRTALVLIRRAATSVAAYSQQARQHKQVVTGSVQEAVSSPVSRLAGLFARIASILGNRATLRIAPATGPRVPKMGAVAATARVRAGGEMRHAA